MSFAPARAASGVILFCNKRHACRVPVATFAALLQTADKRTAETQRATFAAWCAARPDLPADWRAAWTLYRPASAVPIAKPAPPISRSPARAFLASL
jgi:ferric-dicitrate binding protein FerR (iron transport regulator)